MRVRVIAASITVLILLMSLVLGLVRENVLRDPDVCCLRTNHSLCDNLLLAQIDAFYNPATGLKTQYIVSLIFVLSTFFFFVTKSKNTVLVFCQRPAVIVLVAIVCFLCVSLFNGTSVDTFTVIDSMQPNCTKISTKITNAIAVYSWFNFILGVALFYAFVLSLPAKASTSVVCEVALPSLPFPDSEDSDESDHVIYVDKPVYERVYKE